MSLTADIVQDVNERLMGEPDETCATALGVYIAVAAGQLATLRGDAHAERVLINVLQALSQGGHA